MTVFLKTLIIMPAKEYKETDPYHPENLIGGIIYDDNDRYGDLLIKIINGINCEQLHF